MKYTLLTDDGDEYGPYSVTELNGLLAENRLVPTSRLRREDGFLTTASIVLDNWNLPPSQQQTYRPYSQTQAQPKYAPTPDKSIPHELYAYQPLMWATAASGAFSAIMSWSGYGDASISNIMSVVGTVAYSALSHSNIKAITPYLDAVETEKVGNFINLLWAASAASVFYTIVPFGPDVIGGPISYSVQNNIKYLLGLVALVLAVIWLPFYRDRIIAGKYFAFSPVTRVELGMLVLNIVALMTSK